MHLAAQKIKGLIKEKKETLFNHESYHLTSLKKAPDMASVIWEAKKALKQGIYPLPLNGASSKVFLMRDMFSHPLCIFKMASHNHDSEKEVGAYRLDHFQFAKVPQTVFASFEHAVFKGNVKGSCQYYVQDSCPVHALSQEQRDSLSSEEVRRIATLDIRLINTDRHTSNLLFQQGSLIPIDHAASLPLRFYGFNFAWSSWPQAKTPFTKDEKHYIANLDLDEDRRILIEELRLPTECVDLQYGASLLLQYGVHYGLTIHHIAKLIRKHEETIDGKKVFFYGPFEKAYYKAKKSTILGWNFFKQSLNREILTVVEHASNTLNHQETSH